MQQAIRCPRPGAMIGSVGVPHGVARRPERYSSRESDAGATSTVRQDFQLGRKNFPGTPAAAQPRASRHGIVRGLRVSVQPDGGNGAQVVIPGFAIAHDGEDIEVPCQASADLPKRRPSCS